MDKGESWLNIADNTGIAVGIGWMLKSGQPMPGTKKALRQSVEAATPGIEQRCEDQLHQCPHCHQLTTHRPEDCMLNPDMTIGSL